MNNRFISGFKTLFYENQITSVIYFHFWNSVGA